MITYRAFVRGTVLVAILALPWAVHAQETSLSGVVTDVTNAVLPGVTVTALHLETGNVFVAVTDASGQYRIGAMRTGVHNITAELPGFTTITQENLQLVVGQSAVLNFTLTLASVQEAITVTGQSPLIDVQQSELGGRVDQRQIKALPVLGRNWMALTILAPGSRANDVTESPTGLPGARSDQGYYQLNMDGMQVTNTMAGSSFGNIKFARDSISEFEFQSSRFDATQGRSMGMMVNTVSKSGTNTLTGSAFGYFRHDKFNAADPVVGRVLPYSNQQAGFSVGGPLIENQLHYFGYYEGEREPVTYFWNTPWPAFNIPQVRAARVEHKFGARLDTQLDQNNRVMVRISGWKNRVPRDGHNSDAHPSNASRRDFSNYQAHIGLTQTFGGNKVHELKVFWHMTTSFQQPTCCFTAPTIRLRGLTVGKSVSHPLNLIGRTYAVRDDFTLLVNAKGSHTVKVGGDFLWNNDFYEWNTNRFGNLDATGGARPANVEQLFPVWNDPSTWNLAPLGPISVRWQQSFGDWTWNNFVPYVGAWVQDDWLVHQRLTLNLGLRWDYAHNWAADQWDLQPLRHKTPNDFKNFGPRLGFAYRATERTVLRGGLGRYYIGPKDQWSHHTPVNVQLAVPSTENPGGITGNGRPDFVIDPYNGRRPTVEGAFQQRRDTSGYVVVVDAFVPYSNQTSIGLQQQLGQTISFQTDYVWTDSRGEQANWNNNLTYNPETGVNYPFRDLSKRPFEGWGIATQAFSAIYSDYHALETAFTKRFSNRWQASATYTLSKFGDYDPSPVFEAFPVAPDLGGTYGPAAGEQTHRAVFNAIWEAPAGVQVSGLYFYGSGQRQGTSYGADLRDSGGKSNRLRPDGTVMPRNNFVGDPIHRVDLRFVRPFRIAGSVRVEGSLELFNVLNHKNFASYTTAETNPRFGRPSQTFLTAYVPRTMALGFAVDF